MLKIFFINCLLLCSFSVGAKSIVTLKGSAKGWVGSEVKVSFYEDYLSFVKTQVAATKVNGNSLFETSFYVEDTRKVIVEIGRKNLTLYVQPNGSYELNIEEDGNSGEDLSFYFIDLDTNDINFKILVYEDYQLNFLERFYNKHTVKSTEFVTRLDTFKLNIENRYKADTNTFFKRYIKYSVASLDNLSFVGQRNAYEKYDFYLKSESVYYQNDRYMDYIKHFYNQYESQLSSEVSEGFYNGILKGSPSLIMNALGGDYTLKNLRLRELILIRMMGEVFYSGQYPQTNIITVLDSISNHALFDEHKSIASNITFRLLDLRPGTRMPDFSLIIDGEKKFKKEFSGKHVYFQFVNSNTRSSIGDIKLLAPIYQKYAKYIDFVTVLVADDENDPLFKDPSSFIREHGISWEFSIITKDNSMIKSFGVSKYPYYILMDAVGYVVSAPALSPRPNNEYETIEKNLFPIARYYRHHENQD